MTNTSSMKTLLKLEELVQFLACALVLVTNQVEWWWYGLLLVGPDIGMVGYLVSTRIGAFTYNLLHHKGLALVLLMAGGLRESASVLGELLSGVDNAPDTLWLTGLILYGHASMDRIFGYGLKFGDSFQHTHLGWIGKGKAGSEQ